MNQFLKHAALVSVLLASVPALQVHAQNNVPVEQSGAAARDAAFNAIVNSADPGATIAALVAAGASPEMIASVATVAGISLATITLALPTVSAASINTAVNAAKDSPASFVSLSTASNPTALFNALTNSANPEATMTALAALGVAPEMIASVAAIAGVSSAKITAALHNQSTNNSTNNSNNNSNFSSTSSKSFSGGGSNKPVSSS